MKPQSSFQNDQIDYMTDTTDNAESKCLISWVAGILIFRTPFFEMAKSISYMTGTTCGVLTKLLKQCSLHGYFTWNPTILMLNSTVTFTKQKIICSPAVQIRTSLCTFFQSMVPVGLQRSRSASPRGLVHPDLLGGIGQLAAWHLSQQSLLSKHGIYHCSSRKDSTYLMGRQKRLLLPYAGNCQGLFTPRLATFSARKRAFQEACQKKYK